MKNTIEQSVKVKESEISVVAYQMWEKAGRPAGRDLQFWLDAEGQLRAAAAKAASAAPATPISPVASDSKAVRKAANGQLGPSRPNSATAQQVRKF
ncbi:MAG TPA: DUF2934 domain-containing protein [Verrucomicrobiae bacterium]|nr:DUF2934 domain-containing protein [Verrucomicrobiae bacterium]